MPTHRWPFRAPIAFLAAGLWLSACSPEDPAPSEAPSPAEIAGMSVLDPPAGLGASSPHLSDSAGPVILTWLEPTDGGHTLRLSKLQGETWGPPLDVSTGGDFFANWADLPMAVESTAGTLFAHWLEKLGEDTYAYGIRLKRSADGGASWQDLGLLHDDASPTEHGFVSYAALPSGEIQAFWLDGRAMLDGGSMQLRTTRLDAGDPGPGTVLDDRVCECCATDAALAADGPVVVYRDRSESEIRDIAVIRATDEGWTEPAFINDDGWQIHGCPVNGPAIAADGNRLAVAWFTSADGPGKVQVAHSTDGGATFTEPVLVDDDQPFGRVDIVLTADGDAVVSWLGSADDGAENRGAENSGAENRGAEILWRRFPPGAEPGPVQVVSTTNGTRSAGVPRMIRRGDELLFVWIEEGESARLRAGLIPLS